MAETVKNIAVLEKALHIMEFLLAYPKGVQLNEISIGVGLNKSTVYRILHTLRLHNYVIQDEKDSSYSLGNRFLLYSPFIQSLSINNVALPFMQEFSDRYDFSTSLATLDKDPIFRQSHPTLKYPHLCRGWFPLSTILLCLGQGHSFYVFSTGT